MRKSLLIGALITPMILVAALPAFAKNHNPPPAPPTATTDGSGYFNSPSGDTVDYQIQTDGGFDDNGILLPDPPATYKQRYAVWEIDQRCRADLKSGVEGILTLQAKVGIKTFIGETIGAVLGTMLGSPMAGASYLRAVAGQVGGAALGGGLAGGNEEAAELMSAAVSYCVLERVDRHRSIFYNVIIVPTIRFHSKGPQTSAPGIEPDPNAASSSSNAADMTANKLSPSTLPPPHF